MEAPSYITQSVARLVAYWMNSTPEEVEEEVGAWYLIATGKDRYVFEGEGDGSLLLVDVRKSFTTIRLYPAHDAPVEHYVDCREFWNPIGLPGKEG